MLCLREETAKFISLLNSATFGVELDLNSVDCKKVEILMKLINMVCPIAWMYLTKFCDEALLAVACSAHSKVFVHWWEANQHPYKGTSENIILDKALKRLEKPWLWQQSFVSSPSTFFVDFVLG